MSLYAKLFNKKYNYIGHLYQDRYFSIIGLGDIALVNDINIFGFGTLRNDNFYEDRFKYEYSQILHYYKGKLKRKSKYVFL